MGLQRRRERRAAADLPVTAVRTADLLPVAAVPGEAPAGAAGAVSATSQGWIGDALPATAVATPPEQDLSRRLFLARSLAVTAGAVAVGTAGTGAVLANSAPVVRRVPIAIAGLDPALIGYRIAPPRRRPARPGL